MRSRDFSAPTGRRLRITLGVYHPTSKQFRHVKGVAALVTVKNKAEETRLWRAVEATIAGETWKVDDVERGTAAAADGADSGVADRAVASS